MLNANAGVDPDDCTFHQFLEDTGLEDIYRHLHDREKEPASHNRGSKKVDHILGTPGVLGSVTACGIEAFGDGVDSDHRGLFVDFDSIALFGDSTPNLTCMTSRVLDSHIPFYVKKYRRELHDQFMHHNVYVRLRQLKKVVTGPTGELI